MNNFWKNFSSVFLGASATQLIPIFGSLIIARIFSPTEFGEFSSWLAIVTFFSIITTLRLETMLALTEDGTERAKAIFFIFVVTVLMAILFFACLIGAKTLQGKLNYIPNSPALFLTIIPAALFTALNQIWQTWAATEGSYGKLNAMRLIQASALVLLQIGAGLKYPTAAGLVVGFIFASGIAFVCSVNIMPKFIYKKIFNAADFRKFLYRYINFPLYALPADAINTAAGQLPVLVASYRFGNETAGYLALTMRVLGTPIGLVGKSALDVFKRYAIQSIQEAGNCRVLYINTFIALTIASLIFISGTIFLAEDIFFLAFGPEWLPAAHMAIWLLPMFALRMIASPLSYITYLVERQHIDLLWQFGLIFITITTLHAFASYRITIIIYSIGCAIMYLIYISISYQLSKG